MSSVLFKFKVANFDVVLSKFVITLFIFSLLVAKFEVIELTLFKDFARAPVCAFSSVLREAVEESIEAVTAFIFCKTCPIFPFALGSKILLKLPSNVSIDATAFLTSYKTGSTFFKTSSNKPPLVSVKMMSLSFKFSTASPSFISTLVVPRGFDFIMAIEFFGILISLVIFRSTKISLISFSVVIL